MDLQLPISSFQLIMAIYDLLGGKQGFTINGQSFKPSANPFNPTSQVTGIGNYGITIGNNISTQSDRSSLQYEIPIQFEVVTATSYNDSSKRQLRSEILFFIHLKRQLGKLTGVSLAEIDSNMECYISEDAEPTIIHSFALLFKLTATF